MLSRREVTYRLFFAVIVIVSAVIADDIVVLKQGSLKGHRLSTRRGRTIFAFQGIPFSKPPVGDFRFQPPQSPEPWNGVLDATKEGPVCVQRGLFPTEKEMQGSEDCLYLNVYTPRLPEGNVMLEPLDVMFWIYGGGFFAGSGNSESYGPQYLLDKDVILVTSNYRLGALGFLSTGDKNCPGNNGLKDQVAALRWVKDNIVVFGGNPDSVTIFGESAGGYSVHFHMLSPVSKGLFQHAISQSGNALTSRALIPTEASISLTKKLATLFNCPSECNEKLLSCLRKQEAYEIVGSDRSLSEAGGSSLGFRPVIETQVGEGDEAFIPEDPMQTLLEGKIKLVPWMVGITSSEGGFFYKHFFKKGKSEVNLEETSFLAPVLDNSAGSHDISSIVKKIQDFYFDGQPITNDSVSSVINLLTDTYFLIGTNTAVKLHSKRGATVFYYYFDYRGTNSFSSIFVDPVNNYGVIHLDDIMYLFPQDSKFPDKKKSANDEYMVDYLTTLWVNFARTGVPTPSWHPVSSPDVLEYAHFDQEGLHMSEGLLAERTKFWDSLPIRNKYPMTDKKEEL